MSETKFTPGPWSYRPQEFDDWGYVRAAPNEAGEQWPVALARAGRSVRAEEDEHRRNDTDPYEANGHLIAAAPDLFAVLAEAVACNAVVEGSDWWGKVFAALAKARGEQ